MGTSKNPSEKVSILKMRGLGEDDILHFQNVNVEKDPKKGHKIFPHQKRLKRHANA